MKNIFKHITFSAILLMLAGGFSSCNDKKEEPFLTVDETPIIENAEAGSYSISINSSEEWFAVVESMRETDWCTLENNTGTGNSVITVTVAENTLNIARSAIVKITSGNLEKLVTIKQRAATGEDGYPIEVPFTEYPLANDQPLNRSPFYRLNIELDKIVLVNNNEELYNYIDCTDGSCSEIDFSEYTLLLAKGVSNYGIYFFEKQFHQISDNEYSLYVYVDIGYTHIAVGDAWVVSVLIPKLSQDNTFLLDIDRYPPF